MQIPSTKIQIPNKSQIQNPNSQTPFQNLELGMAFGIRNFEFGISCKESLRAAKKIENSNTENTNREQFLQYFFLRALCGLCGESRCGAQN